MIKKIEQYLTERQKWIKAGKPIRSADRIKELYILCQENKCGNFNVKNCNLCGCNISPKGTKLNKLAWSTTECPHEKKYWGMEPEAAEKLKEAELVEASGKDKTQADTTATKPIATKSSHSTPARTPSAPRPPKKKGGCGCGKS